MKLKHLLPDLKKVPIRFSLAIILSSPLVAYLLMSRPVNADVGEWLRKGINQAASEVGITPKTLPVPSQPAPVGTAGEIDPCAAPPPRQVAYSAPAASRVGSYWVQSLTPTDDRAKVLLNLAKGTTRRSVNTRVGMGTNDNGHSTYDTSNGLIRVEYDFVSGPVLNDRVRSVTIVR